MLFLSFFLFASEALVGPKNYEKWSAYWQKPPVDIVSLVPKSVANGEQQAKEFAKQLKESKTQKFLEYSNTDNDADIDGGQFRIIGKLNNMYRVATKDQKITYTVIVCNARTTAIRNAFIKTLLAAYENKTEIFENPLPARSSSEEAVSTLNPEFNPETPPGDERQEPILTNASTRNTQNSQERTSVQGALIGENQALKKEPENSALDNGNNGTPPRKPGERADTPPTEPRPNNTPRNQDFLTGSPPVVPPSKQNSFYKIIQELWKKPKDQKDILRVFAMTTFMALFMYNKWPTLRKFLGM